MNERVIRINKVLRELNISLDRAVEFLKGHGITIDANPNAKISEREYSLLVVNFAHDRIILNDVQIVESNLKIMLKEGKTSPLKQNEYIQNDLGRIIKLNIIRNNISDLSFLKPLLDIEELHLSANDIHDISILKDFTKLEYLDLSYNQIQELNPLNELKSLTFLNLAHNRILSLNSIGDLQKLKILIIWDNLLEDINIVNNFTQLTKLYAGGNSLVNIDFSRYLKNLRNLELNRNSVVNLSGIKNLINLQSLSLESNKITDINDIINLKKLTFLNLKNNFINDIRILGELKNLKNLDLSLNAISDIAPLASLTKLKDFRAFRNEIVDILPIQNFLRTLRYIDIDENPIIEEEGWKIDEKTIQIDLIKEYFSRRKSIQVKFKMPVKILLLGNHAAGKSTLLHYLLNRGDFKIPKPDNNSTHIIRIEKFPAPSDEQLLPDVIFYDFGGQDYYHGIYKAFLTNDAVNLLLWNTENNKNQLREDSNKELTRDFTREYWLHQLMYYFEKNLSQEDDNNPIILIQTHADKRGSYRDTFKDNHQQFNIENEFFISLSSEDISESPLFQGSLRYLMVQINHEISKKKKIIERPSWYGDFINYILRSTEKEATSISVILTNYKRERQATETKNDILNFLKSDLDQLHKQGLILYYKNELPEVAWLNPTATTQYIHSEILQKKLFNSEGKIAKNTLEKETDHNVIQLLLFQKVIFLDIKDNKYVVPNFLKLASDKKNDYNIITFGIDRPDFVLKFKKFLPFGLVNQLVSHFGNNNGDSKYFWRDQLIFTLEKVAKILIKLDFNNLEISVYFQFIVQDSQKREDIKKYIFLSIMAVYWDSYLVTFPEFIKRFSNHNVDEEISLENHSEPDNQYVAYKHFVGNFNHFPDDLLLSIDNVKFVSAKDFLSKIESKKNVIQAYVSSLEDIALEIQGNEVNGIIRKVDYEDITEEPIYKYQIFSNIKIKKMKKIFVSYSHSNTAEMNELRKFLVGFERSKEIEKWTDLQLQAGVKVKDEILRNLAEADIVILLISQDFIASDFIYDNELQLAMQKKLKGSAEIVPVVLSESTIFDLNLDISLEDGLEEKVLMGQYYFIPQDENNNLKPIEKWSSRAEAWMVIYRHLKKIINN